MSSMDFSILSSLLNRCLRNRTEFAEGYNILFSWSCITLMAWLYRSTFYFFMMIYPHLQINGHSLQVYICHYQKIYGKSILYLC